MADHKSNAVIVRPTEAATVLLRGLSPLEQQMPLLAAQQAGANMYGSPHLNPFTLLAPGELALSRVLADLLDVHGSHGQGPLFLNEICRVAGLPAVGLRDYVKVSREALTRHGRRIDVLVETQSILLGVENKPWAAQQANQLADYLDELRLRAAGREVALVFLSSQEERSAKGAVINLPLASNSDGELSLAATLSGVAKLIRSERARRFIDDFVQYLEWEFGGVAQVADLEAYTNAVENEFGQSGERRQAIAAVMLTVDRLWDTVVDQVGEYLLTRIQEEVAADFETDKQYGLCDYLVGRWEVWPLRRPTWPENCMVGLEPQQLDAKSILVGVKAPDPSDSRVQKEHGSAARAQLDRLTDQVGGGRTSPWWAWHKALEPSSWDTDYIARLVLESPKGDVTQHPTVQQLGDLVVELGRVVEARLNAGRQPA